MAPTQHSCHHTQSSSKGLIITRKLVVEKYVMGGLNLQGRRSITCPN
jgi:hypothetical protein